MLSPPAPFPALRIFPDNVIDLLKQPHQPTDTEDTWRTHGGEEVIIDDCYVYNINIHYITIIAKVTTTQRINWTIVTVVHWVTVHHSLYVGSYTVE